MEHGFFYKSEIVIGGHFPVSVISQNREDVEKLLAPYQENNMNTCPKEYLTFVDARQEYDIFAQAYGSFNDFVAHIGFAFDEEHGKYGRWENLDAKWDWYRIGGNFDGFIPLKGGGCSSCCRIGDVDAGQSDAARKKALQYWDETVAPMDRLDASVRELYLTCYGDRENFANKRSHFFTGALLTPDGIWHDIGKNGKIQKESSCSIVENYYYRFQKAINETNPGYWLTVVDCHM